MSDVELLREAARLMRERANAATPGPWQQSFYHVFAPGEGHGVCYDAFTTADAEHTASWQPAVALAVADWLDWTAPHMAHHIKAWSSPHAITKGDPEMIGRLVEDHFGRALAVARAYLGRQP